ncbi:MAG: type I glyceraldehyde-3-phosphate dehydrogenase, partial [Spirochaetota bacterium]
MARIAINGLGRIGRATLKIIEDTPDLDLVAVNDLVPADTLAYLLKYDSVYGRYQKDVKAEKDSLSIDGRTVKVLSEKDPTQLPWKDMNVDIVIESTGLFTEEEGAKKHITAGAKHVIISAPTKSKSVRTVVHGVNEAPNDEHVIISCASCTTNSITPPVEIIGRHIGIKKAMLTTVHAYTSTQSLVDSPSKKLRRGRAAAVSIIPSSTGAAVATTEVLPEHQGKFDGTSLRVPTPVGSISDITFVTERPTSAEEVNKIMREEAKSDKYKGIMAVSEDEIVSSDVIQDPHASVIDLTGTMVVDGDLLKVMAWYDNEWGYSNQMVREALNILS